MLVRMKLLMVALLSVTAFASAQGGNVPVVLFGPSQASGAAVDLNPTGMLLGGWKGGRWQDAAGVKSPWSARWQVFTLGQAARTATLSPAKSEAEGESCSETLFSSASPPLKFARSGMFGVALPAGVKAQPRPVTVFPNTSDTYRAIVAQELSKLGLKNVPVRINTILRVDLDGNGTQEVLIEASNIGLSRFYPDGSTSQGGQYSVVLLRTVQGQAAVTRLLAQDVVVKDLTAAQVAAGEMRVMTRFGIAGVLDVNGDGRMEVVLASAYYEGLAGSVLEFTPGWGAAVVAESGCGV